MKKEKVICVNCSCFIKEYRVEEVDDVVEFRGVSIPYKRKDAYCCACGNLVYVASIEDYNVQEPLRIYKEIKQ